MATLTDNQVGLMTAEETQDSLARLLRELGIDSVVRVLCDHYADDDDMTDFLEALLG